MQRQHPVRAQRPRPASVGPPAARVARGGARRDAGGAGGNGGRTAAAGAHGGGGAGAVRAGDGGGGGAGAGPDCAGAGGGGIACGQLTARRRAASVAFSTGSTGLPGRLICRVDEFGPDGSQRCCTML
jgi:hypothetical protein